MNKRSVQRYVKLNCQMFGGEKEGKKVKNKTIEVQLERPRSSEKSSLG